MNRRLRFGIDVFWVVAFCGVIAHLSYASQIATATLTDVTLNLELPLRRDVYGVFWNRQRIGMTRSTTERSDTGWTVKHTLQVADHDVAQLGLAVRKDLSLRDFSAHIDLQNIAEFSALRSIVGVVDRATVNVRGDCTESTKQCQLVGRIGDADIHQRITIGQGPVLNEAIYPLLTRGILGTRAELDIFDPLTLKKRRIVFIVEGRDDLQLKYGKVSAYRVRQEIDELSLNVWLAADGAVLRQEFPFGLWLEHEGKF